MCGSSAEISRLPMTLPRKPPVSHIRIFLQWREADGKGGKRQSKSGALLILGPPPPPQSRRSIRSANSDIGNPDESFHCVLLAGGEIHGKIGDVTGLDADHLHAFVIRKIRQGMSLLYPRIPHHSRTRILFRNSGATM